MDLSVEEFASEVGSVDPVAVVGLGTRRTPPSEVRLVHAPAGIEWVQPAEMTMKCGAGTSLVEVDAALAEHGQQISLPPGGTIGGALAMGQSGIRRLAYGAMRDTLLQTHYVNGVGKVVKAGGPTVKNVSGFDLCRLLVGSRGALGFLGDVILRTRPMSSHERWFRSQTDPFDLLASVYRPTSMLWNGETTWVLLEGDESDIDAQAARFSLESVDVGPELPTAARWSMPPAELESLRVATPGSFVAEIGVGIVHHTTPRPASSPDPVQTDLHRRIKEQFDPLGRLNPGLELLATP